MFIGFVLFSDAFFDALLFYVIFIYAHVCSLILCMFIELFVLLLLFIGVM